MSNSSQLIAEIALQKDSFFVSVVLQLSISIISISVHFTAPVSGCSLCVWEAGEWLTHSALLCLLIEVL